MASQKESTWKPTSSALPARTGGVYQVLESGHRHDWDTKSTIPACVLSPIGSNVAHVYADPPQYSQFVSSGENRGRGEIMLPLYHGPRAMTAVYHPITEYQTARDNNDTYQVLTDTDGAYVLFTYKRTAYKMAPDRGDLSKPFVVTASPEVSSQYSRGKMDLPNLESHVQHVLSSSADSLPDGWAAALVSHGGILRETA